MSPHSLHLQRRQRAIHRWTALTLTLLYVLGISGAPAGPGAMRTGCRCDQSLQIAGNCCCSKEIADEEAALPACCAGRKKQAHLQQTVETCSTTKACCASTKSVDQQRQEQTQAERPPSARSCGCDAPIEAGYLLNTDPRVLTESTSPHRADTLVATIASLDSLLLSCVLLPETPPPKSLSV